MDKPHIFLLTVDTLRVDHLSCYRDDGYIATPNIDRLASDGEVFTNVMSCANQTVPSYTGLLTGRYPSSVGMKITSKLNDDIPTLPLVLQNQGYYTACWTVASAVGKKNGVAKDFEHYELVPSRKFRSGRLLAKIGIEDPALRLQSKLKALKHLLWRLETVYTYWLAMNGRLGPSGGPIIVKGLKQLCADGHHQLFVLANFFEPHSPYYPPKRYWTKELTAREYLSVLKFNLDHWNNVIRSKRLRERDRSVLFRLYKSEVMGVDELIGDFIGYLKETQLYDNALIVLTADHGESIGDHNLLGHWHALYEDLIHIPLIIKWPGNSRRGKVSKLVQNVDIAPTLLEYLGVEAQPRMDGLSLLDHIPEDRVGFAEQIDNPIEIYSTRPAFPRWQEAMSEFNYSAVALRQGDYKYIAYSTGKRELFNLAHDPQEIQDVSETECDRAAHFEALLVETERDNVVSPYTETEGERILSHLEQLGYV